MLGFISFLLEAAKPKKPSAKNRADSMGKVHEILVGGYLNPHEDFPEHYRTEEGSPSEVHHIHATAMFGNGYKHNPEYHRMHHHASEVADMIRKHAKKHGIKDIKRVAWTSQPSDHESETGVKDPNSKADLIVTGHNGKQVGLSLKVGKTKTPNYSNPGVKTLESWSGAKLGHHAEEHGLTLTKYGNPNHDQYKEMRDGSSPNGRASAAEIKNSSDIMNKKMAADVHNGFSKKSDSELRDVIRQAASPPTYLPTVVAHTMQNRDGSATHAVHDQSDHIEHYLNQFDNLHAKARTKDSTTATIHGIHKKTGKVMPVMNVTVYAGGRPSNKAPRGATTLPSESNKDVVAGMAH